MDIKQLENVVKIVDRSGIHARLKELGFLDCSKDEMYKKFPILTILESEEQQETEWFQNQAGNFEYQGVLVENVPGEGGRTFVLLSVNDIDPDKRVSLPMYLDVFVSEKIH